MKTVCVFATIKNGEIVHNVIEHSVFGKKCEHKTASDFIKICQSLWKNHTEWYTITNIVIEG
ncbi:hypothetical protein D3C85_541740 [compost metagenome]